jgi:hypothetical protein
MELPSIVVLYKNMLYTSITSRWNNSIQHSVSSVCREISKCIYIMPVFGITAEYTGSNVFREMTTYYVNDNFWDNGRLDYT